MRSTGSVLRQALADFPPDTFEGRFWARSNRLGLSEWLADEELLLLRQAAFVGTLCRIAFNGLGGCKGQIRPERERHRAALELQFMAAQARFFACEGWSILPATQRALVLASFLRAPVAEENLSDN